jgi:DNA-binding transcriptional ArsR family regulator
MVSMMPPSRGTALTAAPFICKFWLTGETLSQGVALTSEAELLAVLTAVANPLRLRVVAELSDGRVHVSELARRLGISRPLLYMHLDRLEKAGLISGHLELSEDGKAMKYYDLDPFELRLNAQVITDAVRASGTSGQDVDLAPEEQDTEMKETASDT